ncbi:MAG: PQQ-binding-like beta-propeller repeat protein [Candidatus Micrarchaeota archaeon]|nr:PQQ-binding-like beta-propeller repeat protein [Candidatus Micrarchaeota archaeon]
MDGNVYFVDWNGDVYSANIVNGSSNWAVNLGYPISSTPEIVNGIIYIGLSPNLQTEVFALSQKDGHTIWNTKIKTTSKQIWSSPIFYNGLIYIGVTGDNPNDTESNASIVGGIYALNASNGNLVWNFNTMISNTGGDGVWSSVVVDPTLGSIYFGTGNPYISANNPYKKNSSGLLYSYSIISLNATNGKLNWYYQAYNSFQAGGDFDFGSTPNLFTITSNGITYNVIGLGNKDGSYYILNRVNGKFINKFSISNGTEDGIIGLAGFIYLSETQVNPELFIPSQYSSKNGSYGGVVEALYPSNGSIKWKFFTNGNLEGSVSIIPGAVIFGDNTGNLYVVSILNGTQLFHTTFVRNIVGGITPADGYLFVPTAFGSQGEAGLYEFSIQQGNKEIQHNQGIIAKIITFIIEFFKSL